MKKKKYCLYLTEYVRARIEYLAATTGRSFSDVVTDAIVGHKQNKNLRRLHIEERSEFVCHDIMHCDAGQALAAYCKFREAIGKPITSAFKFTAMERDGGEWSLVYDPATGEICTA